MMIFGEQAENRDHESTKAKLAGGLGAVVAVVTDELVHATPAKGVAGLVAAAAGGLAAYALEHGGVLDVMSEAITGYPMSDETLVAQSGAPHTAANGHEAPGPADTDAVPETVAAHAPTVVDDLPAPTQPQIPVSEPLTIDPMPLGFESPVGFAVDLTTYHSPSIICALPADDLPLVDTSAYDTVPSPGAIADVAA